MTHDDSIECEEKHTYSLRTVKTRICLLPTEIKLTEDDAAQIRKMIQQH